MPRDHGTSDGLTSSSGWGQPPFAMSVIDKIDRQSDYVSYTYDPTLPTTGVFEAEK
jgi:hypothetical protein